MMTEKTSLLHIDIHNLAKTDPANNQFATSYSIIHFVFDLLLPIILAVVLGVIAQVKFPVRELGFFCDDKTISYPYRDSTVKSYILYITLIPIILTFIFLTLVENFSYLYASKRLQTLKPQKPMHIEINCIFCKIKIPFCLWKFIFILYAFAVGYLANVVVTYSFKLSVGELRPHFLDVCKPNFSLITCKGTDGIKNYVTNYTCTGEPDLVREGRLSFPSGHSSIITYNMAFLIFYLETKHYIPRGIRSMLSLIFAITACLISLSRLDDFKHHFHDILAGMALGLLIAMFTYFYLMRLNVVNNQATKDQYRALAQDEDINTPSNQ